MKFILSLLLLLLSCTSAFAGPEFPTHPDPSLTPGSLCESPDSKRYPEGIPYCSRKVGSELKVEIMRNYDSNLGFHVTQMNRGAFKIDHHIPLCMGGSNREDNLWPQHESIYRLTDRLEQVACEKMAKGKLRQAEAVELIRRAKSDPKSAPELERYVSGL